MRYAQRLLCRGRTATLDAIDQIWTRCPARQHLGIRPRTMTPSQWLKTGLETFLILLVLFGAHRGLTLPIFAEAADLPPREILTALSVGFLSDVWVAYLCTLLITLTSTLIAWHSAKGAKVARTLWLLSLGVMVSAHQVYVSFFRFQVIPFHLRYLGDPDFLVGNGLSLFDIKALILFLIFAVSWLCVQRFDPLRSLSASRLKYVHALLAVLVLVAHNRNIHLRVQWFVPENLQVNLLERLYLQAKSSELPEPLTPADLRTLAEITHLPDTQIEDAKPATLKRLLTRSHDERAELQEIARTLRGEFQQSLAAGKRPLILIALLESLRPAETGYFAQDDKPSLTPRLDELAAKGLVFTHAFATGSVTRGAQEAVFCGYLGSRDTSLMRGFATAPFECLPEVVATQKHTATTFWHHGGEGRFDNQLAFWRARGVQDLLSAQDFPSHVARTGWGVGDASFLAKSARRLQDLKSRMAEGYLMGLVLTVTNHIPWTLPDDSLALELPNISTPIHPSHLTTAYTDAAFGTYVEDLRQSGLWDEAIVIVASDHGNLVEPYHDLYANTPLRPHLLQSHINFLVTGGLVDRALQREDKSSLTIDSVVSQADVAPLIAYVLDLPKARFMAENPLRLKRSLPVISTLEQDVFDPLAMRAYSRRDAARATSLAPEATKTSLYFRALLQYIYTGATNSDLSR